MRSLLRPFGWLYGLIVRVRNLFFDVGILRSVAFPLPVIAVGNLIAGGSGKSPHVLLLIELLKNRYRVAVLSRGYGRKTKGFRLVSATDTSDQSGDEPLQYLHYHPEICVAVCEKREEGIHQLLALPNPPQLILLDDAYQHRYVKAGFNILLTEYNNLFTQDQLLPEGMLREPKSGASRADFIIVTKAPEELNIAEVEQINSQLRKYSSALVTYSYMRYRELIALFSNPAIQPTKITPVLLVTGIARPQPLVKHIQKNFSTVEHIAFADHHRFTREDMTQIQTRFNSFVEKYPGAVLVTTRKDAMRFSSVELSDLLHLLPVYIMDIEAVITEDLQQFTTTINSYVEANS